MNLSQGGFRFVGECRVRNCPAGFDYLLLLRVFIEDKKQRDEKVRFARRLRKDKDIISCPRILRGVSDALQKRIAVGVVQKVPVEILQLVLWLMFEDFKQD